MQSEASADHYAHNTRTNFRNHLAIPINVDASRYEVALTELTYTYNDPYIKANTHLYTIYELSEPTINRHTNAKVKDIPGDAFDDEIAKEVLNYAKENKVQISYAKSLANNIPQTGEKVTLIYTNGVFKATKDITSTSELITELNTLLAPLDITVTDEIVDGEHEVNIVQNSPEVLMEKKIYFSNTIIKHFAIGQLDSAQYKNGKFIVNSVTSDESLDIKKGDELCKIKFITEEIEVNANPTYEEQENFVCKASEDIYTIQDLAKEMTSPFVEVTVERNRATLSISTPTLSRLVFNDRVNGILGINIPKHISPNENVTVAGKDTTVWDLGCKKIFVYTDIIEDQRVGDQVAPLLRISDYTGQQDKITIKDFNQLQYIRLRYDNIDSIRIYLKTETGEDLPLTFGTVSCTLHFREKRF